MKRTSQYDTKVTKRLADFVRGRTDIPRDMVVAAFPRVSAMQLSLLVELGYVQRTPRGCCRPGQLPEAFRAYHQQKRPEWDAKKAVKRREKIDKLEAKLAALRESEAAQ